MCESESSSTTQPELVQESERPSEAATTDQADVQPFAGSVEIDGRPETDAEWFGLIEPAIDIDAEAADPAYVERIAERHARQVVDLLDDFDVDVDGIMWQASPTLEEVHGRYTTPISRIKLSLPSLHWNGWQALLNTVRHELVHAWQDQHDEHFPPADSVDSHDLKSFERWMDPLSIRKAGKEFITQPRYRVRCPDCEFREYSDDVGQRIRRVLHGAESCPECGRSDDDPLVVDDLETGERLQLQSDEYQLLPAAHRIVTYEKTTEGPTEHRELIEFPGIGKRRVEQLGSEFMEVSEMVDGTALAERVQEVVSSQYHDDLWADLRSYMDWQVEGERVWSSRPDPDRYLEDGERVADPDTELPQDPDIEDDSVLVLDLGGEKDESVEANEC